MLQVRVLLRSAPQPAAPAGGHLPPGQGQGGLHRGVVRGARGSGGGRGGGGGRRGGDGPVAVVVGGVGDDDDGAEADREDRRGLPVLLVLLLLLLPLGWAAEQRGQAGVRVHVHR